MKKVLLTLLAMIVVLGLFAATAYAGYRIGYAQGAQGAQRTADDQTPELRPFDRLPLQNWGSRFERKFDRGVGPRGFSMRGLGFFAVLRLLGQLLVLGLIVGFVYWLFKRSGWRLTRTTQTIETQPEPVETETKEQE